MELEALAAAFQGVQMNGRGFKARCPAHADTDPSLSISRGETSWLVTCWAGCTFTDVVKASGLSPMAFKIGGASSSSSQSSVNSFDAQRKLRSMIEETRRIPYRFAEIAEIALCVDEATMRDIAAWYPVWGALPLKTALRMHIVMMDTVIWDMIGGDWSGYGSDWVEAKRTIIDLLWKTYRNERAGLAHG